MKSDSSHASDPVGALRVPGIEILTWLREQERAMVRLVMDMARLESPTTLPATQHAVFELLDREMEALGYQTRRLSGEASGGQLYARSGERRSGRPFQLILGHVDTVWPVGTLEKMPVTEKEGRVLGPGVFDMKGGLTQLIFALRALRMFRLEPRLTPVVFLNSDEETGSGESTRQVRRLARRASRAFVLEPALEPSGKLKTSRRGGGHFEVRVTGRSAHTGLAPGEGASAIHELSHLVQTLYRLSDLERGVTVNVGEISGGVRPNVVAPAATASVDVRVRTLDDARWIEERIRELAQTRPTTPGTELEIRGSMDRPPMEPTPRNRALWHAAVEVGAELGLELEEGMSGGGSDGNTTSLYTATLDGLGAVGDGAHALHEYLEIDRMPERAALLARLLLLPELAPAGEEGVSDR